jgi:hypothetical protein
MKLLMFFFTFNIKGHKTTANSAVYVTVAPRQRSAQNRGQARLRCLITATPLVGWLCKRLRADPPHR